MKTLLTRLGATSAAISIALLPMAVFAQTQGSAGSIRSPFVDAQNLADSVGGTAGIATQRSLPELIGQIINIILGFLGIVLLLLVLYAGFLWMTAGGDDDKVATARTIIANAVIGLIVIVAAFAISNFVLGSLVNIAQ